MCTCTYLEHVEGAFLAAAPVLGGEESEDEEDEGGHEAHRDHDADTHAAVRRLVTLGTDTVGGVIHDYRHTDAVYSGTFGYIGLTTTALVLDWFLS